MAAPRASRATEHAAQRIDAAARAYERAHPEMVEALKVLGIRLEDFDTGLLGAGEPRLIYSGASAPSDDRYRG
jgi:hypothetical protein